MSEGAMDAEFAREAGAEVESLSDGSEGTWLGYVAAVKSATRIVLGDAAQGITAAAEEFLIEEFARWTRTTL